MGVPQDIAALNALVTHIQGQVAALTTDLAGHKTRLEDALSQLAAASTNGASVPDLVAATTAVAQQLSATIDAISQWSNNEVSQSYVDGLLP